MKKELFQQYFFKASLKDGMVVCFDSENTSEIENLLFSGSFRKFKRLSET